MRSFTFLGLLALLQSATGRPYPEERQLLDRHLTSLSRALPDGATPDADATLLKQIAAEAGLRNVVVGAPTVTETGTLGQSRRSLTAAATFPDTDRFFRALQGSPRLIDVEALSLRVADFGVAVEARIRFHHRSARALTSSALDPARARDRTRGATREQAAKFIRDEQLALEKTIALDDLRRRQVSPRMFLAETGASFRDTAAGLVFGSLDGETGRFTLRGLVAGMGAADALERRLEGGFFRLREFSLAKKDGCLQFEAVGESFRAGPEAALPLPVDEPFRPTEALCRQDRDGSPATSTSRATGADASGVTLRAVDVDLADILAMIETLTREPFVAAEDVRGRVNVEFSQASIDDALKSLPVRSERVGSVRLIRTIEGGTFALAETAAEESPIAARLTLRAKRTRGEDVLAAIAETDPSLAAIGPGGLPRVTVIAREAMISDVRRAVLAALKLTESREDGARVLRSNGLAGEIGPIAAVASGRMSFRSRDLTVEEMTLAGIGRTGGEFVAFVYSPTGEIVAIRTGDSLADGVVATLDANAILIDTSEGPVRISLSTAPARSR
jgi:hypothetical protein